MMRSKRLKEAEQAFDKAISIYKDNLSVHMNMAELQALKGDKNKAREIIEMVGEKRTQMSAEEQQKLDILNRRIRSM